MKIIFGLLTTLFGVFACVAFGLMTDYLADQIREANKKNKEKDNEDD